MYGIHTINVNPLCTDNIYHRIQILGNVIQALLGVHLHRTRNLVDWSHFVIVVQAMFCSRYRFFPQGGHQDFNPAIGRLLHEGSMLPMGYRRHMACHEFSSV